MQKKFKHEKVGISKQKSEQHNNCFNYHYRRKLCEIIEVVCKLNNTKQNEAKFFIKW